MKALVIGGGIGGLATALSLHAAGIDCELFEQSRAFRELGVGINILPSAVGELAALGLLDALDTTGIRTHELRYTNRFGQLIWRELRGLDAGYPFPQFSIHRGRLQGLLAATASARLGEDNLHTGHQLQAVRQDTGGVTASFLRRDGSDALVHAQGDLLIAADGIHSTVRHSLYPAEGPPRWNGRMIWRGATAYPPLLTGRSMLIAGGMGAKLVLYPIAQQAEPPGTNLLNWAVVATVGDGSQPPPRREDWNRAGQLAELLPHVDGVFQSGDIDPVAVARATTTIYEYPMCDRDPLPRWSFGRVTLLGDAAHPMYPVGSNGATQAILDARALADCLAATSDVVAAFAAYDAARRPATAAIVQANRAGGPEGVIDLVEKRAPDGFTDLATVATQGELAGMVQGYGRAVRLLSDASD